MAKYFIAAKVAVGSLLIVLFLALLCVALYNQLSINLTDIRTTVPMHSSQCTFAFNTLPKQPKYCPDFNSTTPKPCAKPCSDTNTSSHPACNFAIHNGAELQKLRTEICAYRMAYNRYNERLNRRERQITNSENYQTNIVTVISVIIGLVTLTLAAGTWIFSSTVANNETKVKDAQRELKEAQHQMGKAKQEMEGVQQEIKKAQGKFVDFQRSKQLQIDCEMESLKILRENGFEDYVVASLMIELRIYLPLLASGDEARIKSAARFLGSYTTGYDLPKLAEYARYCRSKMPQELHYLFNFALPENEQI